MRFSPMEYVDLPIGQRIGEFEMYICSVKTNNKITFKHSYKSLVVWFFCTYMIFGPLLNIMRDFSFDTLMIHDIAEYSAFNLSSKLNSLFSFFLFMFFSYLAFYKFFPAKKVLLISGMAVALIAPILIRFFIDQYLFLWIFGETNYLANTTFSFYFSDNTYYAVYYIPAGILYYFFRRNKTLQLARLEAERQRALAEMTQLRSQINPHFLFNSLNNIYSLAYEKSDKILGAIEGLSELLRYALYEKSNFVPFEKEWEKVEQLIKIEQLRLLSPANFKINISKDTSDVMIPPLILLPLIENVFKHGDVQDSVEPATIEASLKNNSLVIEIQNKISTLHQKDAQKGIGLDNIRKRLQHTYGDEATCVVLEKDDTFIAQLSIPLL